MRNKVLMMAAAAALGWVSCAGAAVNYAIDDGTAERTVSIDPGEDQIWFNMFPVQPGGEIINAINVAFGRPGLGGFAMDGFEIEIVLYEDLDGASPANATFLRKVVSVVENAHTNILTRYEIAPTEVHGTILAAALFRNVTGNNQPIAAVDQTAPSLAGRSWAGFTVTGLDETNLMSIPAGQLKPIEEFGVVGNFLLRAEGTPIPEPSSAVLLLAGASLAARRRR